MLFPDVRFDARGVDVDSCLMSDFSAHVHDREGLVTEALAQVLCLHQYFDDVGPFLRMKRVCIEFTRERADFGAHVGQRADLHVPRQLFGVVQHSDNAENDHEARLLQAQKLLEAHALAGRRRRAQQRLLRVCVTVAFRVHSRRVHSSLSAVVRKDAHAHYGKLECMHTYCRKLPCLKLCAILGHFAFEHSVAVQNLHYETRASVTQHAQD